MWGERGGVGFCSSLCVVMGYHKDFYILFISTRSWGRLLRFQTLRSWQNLLGFQTFCSIILYLQFIKKVSSILGSSQSLLHFLLICRTSIALWIMRVAFVFPHQGTLEIGEKYHEYLVYCGIFCFCILENELQTDRIVFPSLTGGKKRIPSKTKQKNAFSTSHVQQTSLFVVFSRLCFWSKFDLGDLIKGKVRHSHSGLTCTVMVDFFLISKVLLLTCLS